MDIPSDIQSAKIDDKYLETIDYQNNVNYIDNLKNINFFKNICHFKNLLANSKRPLVLAGKGIQASKSEKLFFDFVEKNKIPFVTTFLSKDIIKHDYIYNFGSIGIKGNRHSNFIIQNCDLLICLGTSLNISHFGFDSSQFSPLSKKVFINIDENEYLKGNIPIELFIKCDIGDFLKNA
jgi:acetolactate synthase-1/2/3 large subunit